MKIATQRNDKIHSQLPFYSSSTSPTLYFFSLVRSFLVLYHFKGLFYSFPLTHMLSLEHLLRLVLKLCSDSSSFQSDVNYLLFYWSDFTCKAELNRTRAYTHEIVNFWNSHIEFCLVDSCIFLSFSCLLIFVHSRDLHSIHFCAFRYASQRYQKICIWKSFSIFSDIQKFACMHLNNVCEELWLLLCFIQTEHKAYNC